MSGQNTFHDGNHVAVLAGISSADGVSIVLPWVDPITHRLLTTGGGSGSVTVYTETPVGLINGSNTTYSTIHAITSIFSFAINGQFLHPQDIAAGTGDYTFTGSAITFLSALPSSLSGTAFTVTYM